MKRRTNRRWYHVQATVMEKNVIGLVLFAGALYFWGRYILEAHPDRPAAAPVSVPQ